MVNWATHTGCAAAIVDFLFDESSSREPFLSPKLTCPFYVFTTSALWSWTTMLGAHEASTLVELSAGCAVVSVRAALAPPEQVAHPTPRSKAHDTTISIVRLSRAWFHTRHNPRLGNAAPT